MQISVIIPAYKQAHFLGKAIESVLAQSVSPCEVIVVDDCSPDDTEEVCARYRQDIRYIRLPRNSGVSVARNTALGMIRGSLVQFLDADDYLPADTFERHRETWRRQPDAGLYYGGSYTIDQCGCRVGRPREYGLLEDQYHHLLLGNQFPPHAALVRRDAVFQAGLWDVSLTHFEDWDLWLRIAALGYQFVRTPELSVGYRQHGSSATKNLERMRCGAMLVLNKATRYHRNCSTCRRAIANGRWNMRRHFVAQLAANGASASALVTFASWLREDPALAVVGVRDCLRNVKYGLRSHSDAVQ